MQAFFGCCCFHPAVWKFQAERLLDAERALELTRVATCEGLRITGIKGTPKERKDAARDTLGAPKHRKKGLAPARRRQAIQKQPLEFACFQPFSLAQQFSGVVPL